MPEKKLVATEILAFDFELFIGDLFWSKAIIFESIARITGQGYNALKRHLFHSHPVNIFSLNAREHVI